MEPEREVSVRRETLPSHATPRIGGPRRSSISIVGSLVDAVTVNDTNSIASTIGGGAALVAITAAVAACRRSRSNWRHRT